MTNTVTLYIIKSVSNNTVYGERMDITSAEKASLLKNCKIFENTDLKVLTKLTENCSQEVTFRRGEVILSPDADCRRLGMILSGSAQVKKGRAAISSLQRGDVFGAVSLFSDEPNPATSITARVECCAIFFSKDDIERLISENPDTAIGLASYLSNRIRFLTRRIESLTAGDCESKLLSFILDREENGVAEIQSCADLARKLDVGRASLYRALENLEAAGNIRREGKKIYITEKNGVFSQVTTD